MRHLISFTSLQFQVSAERPNPINPIAGDGLLQWLGELLTSEGYETTAPQPEDWGWYIHVKYWDTTYMIGASSDLDEPPPREWTIQILRERSLMDKILGRKKLARDDPLSAHIEAAIRGNPEMHEILVNKGA